MSIGGGNDRVECIVDGSADTQNQSLSRNAFLSQIFDVLQSNSFSIAETEVSSGRLVHAFSLCIILTTVNYRYWILQ